VTSAELREAIDAIVGEDSPDQERVRSTLSELLAALESGDVRAAEPGPDGWQVNRWVKEGILLGFRTGANRTESLPPVFHFRDREIFRTLDPVSTGRDVRIVPGGTTVRRGAHLGDRVVIMPPAYVNVGAFVGEGTMIDSHALVGSCAQVGRGVHVSAAVQIGGVLEPIGALPVIVGDEAFLGGGSGIYEGARVGDGAVLAPGVILTRGTPLHDLPRGRIHTAEGGAPLVVPEGAVVVPGSRRAAGVHASRHGIQLQTPVIVKYRDASTTAAVALEEALR